MLRRLRESSLGRLLPFTDLRVLKSHLPPRVIGFLRRLRELARRGRNLDLQSPAARRAAAQEAVAALPSQPLISLVLPTYKTELRYLREAVESVRAQQYPEWELVIVDDGSGEPKLAREIEALAAADQRIKCELLAENGGISAATNAGLRLCTGEFVGFLDHDDKLTPNALLAVAQALAADPELDVVYSDSDKITIANVRADPFLKPDWSPVYALGAMYIGHLLVVRLAVAEAAGGFDSAYDTIQDFEFMLRVSERTDRIHHIPQILYHWRAIPGSIAAGTDQKAGVEVLQPKAVSAHLERIGAGARAIPHPSIPHRAVLAPVNGAAPAATASIVIAAGPERRGLDRLLTSIFAQKSQPEPEVIVVAPPGGTGDEDRVKWVTDEGVGSNRARANNLGAAAAGGSHLLFLAPDLEVVDADWIGQLLLHASLPGVAAAGPMLVRPDNTVEQAGIAIGLRDPAAPMLAGADADGDGYYGSMPCAREVSALSSDCMLVSREAFASVGGFDELYVGEYEDFDLCRRLAQRGLKAVYAPRPRLLIHRTEAAKLAATDVVDRALFVDNWYDDLLRGDPYFNPNFGRKAADYAPAGWRNAIYRAAAPLKGIR
ncbi:MAG TPA: glycosyltransferase [Solirubrobacterales bacterium]|nr:glycosyltransferase [Solirubrobacterales bacterium]